MTFAKISTMKSQTTFYSGLLLLDYTHKSVALNESVSEGVVTNVFFTQEGVDTLSWYQSQVSGQLSVIASSVLVTKPEVWSNYLIKTELGLWDISRQAGLYATLLRHSMCRLIP